MNKKYHFSAVSFDIRTYSANLQNAEMAERIEREINNAIEKAFKKLDVHGVQKISPCNFEDLDDAYDCDPTWQN